MRGQYTAKKNRRAEAKLRFVLQVLVLESHDEMLVDVVFWQEIAAHPLPDRDSVSCAWEYSSRSSTRSLKPYRLKDGKKPRNLPSTPVKSIRLSLRNSPAASLPERLAGISAS